MGSLMDQERDFWLQLVSSVKVSIQCAVGVTVKKVNSMCRIIKNRIEHTMVNIIMP